MADGSLIFDTRIDSIGAAADLQNLINTATTAATGIEGAFSGLNLSGVNTAVDQLSGEFNTAEIQAEQLGEELNAIEIQAEQLAPAIDNVADQIEDLAAESRQAATNTDRLGDEMSQTARQANTLDSNAASARGSLSKFSGVARGAVAGAAVLGTALTAAGTYAVGLASDLQEVQNVVDVTFGDNASVVNDWAKSAAESFGMSELQAKQFNGTMGAMLSSMGLADDEVLNMSTSVSGLAGDFASFYNLDTQEAFDKIRSGISGETEPLKQLGINMSVANLEAYAMAQGIETAYSAMTQAEQATLRYNYLMSVSANAQGDFARTSDSLANQLRILKLTASDSAATIGTDLLPMVTDTVTELNGMIQQLGTAYETGGIDGLTSAVGDVLGDIVAEITAVVPDVAKAAMSIIEGLVNSLVDNADAIAQGITAITVSLTSGLTGMLPELLQAVLSVARGIIDSLGEAIPDLIPKVINDVLDVITTALSNVDGMVDAGLALIQGLADGLINSIPVLVARLPEIITAILKGIISAAGKLLLGGAEIMRNIRQGMVDEVGDGEEFENIGLTICKAIWNGIKSGFENFGADLYDYMDKSLKLTPATPEIDTSKYADYTKERLSKMFSETQAEYQKYSKELDTFWDTYNKTGIGIVSKDTQAAADAAGMGVAEWLETEVNGLKQQTFELSAAYQAAEKTNEDYNKAIADSEKQKAEQQRKNTEAALAAIREQKEKTQKAISDNTADLAAAWEQINHDYATGVISSEEELYAKRLEAWRDYGDESNKDHWRYYEDIKGMEQNFAADSIRQAEEIAKKQQEAQEKLTAEIKAEKQKQLDIIKDNLKKQLSAAKESINQTISAYKSQWDTVNGYADDYKSKLLDVGDVFTVTTETDEQGNEKTTYAVENMEKQIKAMEDYNADIKRLKEQGASQALLSEVTEMGFEQGSNFADYLDDMSDEEFAKINELYNRREQAAAELSQSLYADELESIKNGFFAELEADLNAMPEIAKQAGADSIQAFIDGITGLDENSFESISKYFENYTETARAAIEGINLDEAIKTSLSEADMSALGLTAGQQFTEGFNQAMAEMSLKMTAGVQAERTSTATAITGVSPTSTATTSSPQTIRLESVLNANLFVDGEKMAKVVTKYQQQTNRQRGQ